jgi:hypothetical protein
MHFEQRTAPVLPKRQLLNLTIRNSNRLQTYQIGRLHLKNSALLTFGRTLFSLETSVMRSRDAKSRMIKERSVPMKTDGFSSKLLPRKISMSQRHFWLLPEWGFICDLKVMH